MIDRGPLLAAALVSAEDWLIEADEPLAGFHRRCAGELPGPLLVPAILEIVRQSRALRLRLAREVRAQDDAHEVRLWIEAHPEGEQVRLILRAWHSQPLPASSALSLEAHRGALAHHTGGLRARLGPRQEVLAVACDCPDLAGLAARMEAGAGQVWTHFVTIAGNNRGQPLHWRLLDGASIRVDGVERPWRAHLLAQGWPEPGSAGFELILVDEDRPGAPSAAPAPPPPRLGLDPTIAPVLRQPVARIIANAQTIRARLAGPLAEEYSAYAADIAAAGEHLLALIDDLSALEAIEDDDFTIAADAIDLADVARRAAGILALRARERGIRLDPPKSDESAPAIGEFHRALQIMLNLVGNAIRYAPEGSQIWLRTETDEGRARAIVADQGEGLDEAEQALIFNRFERLGRSGDGGSGLGLHISRRLAQAMGGSLTVQSAKGQGARFTLALPALS